MTTIYDKFLEEVSLLTLDLETQGLNYDAINTSQFQRGSQSFWPTPKEAAKKMLMSRNKELTKEQVDLIFDSEKELEAKDEERDRQREQKEEARALTREERQGLSQQEKELKRRQRQERREKRKLERRKKIKQYKQIYKDKIKAWKKEAKDDLKQIKNSLLRIWQGFMDIIKRLFKTIIKTATGIAGIIQIIILPPWNIPNAIKQVMDLISSYLNILKAIHDLNPYFVVFDILPLYIEKFKLKIISTIFKPIIQGLRKFFIPIKKFNELIVKLLKWIGKFLGDNKQKIFRRATRKLKKLGHLYRRWLIDPRNGKLLPGIIRGDFYAVGSVEGVEYPCYVFEEEDIDDVQGLLDTFVVGFEGDKTRNRVVDYRRKFSEDAVDLAKDSGFNLGNELDFSSFDFEGIATEFENLPRIETEFEVSEVEDGFIYDIELPDGTIIQNVTEEGVEFYKQNYILKYVDALNQAVLQVSNSI